MIRIDRIWLAVDPMDIRSGLDTTLARVVRVFGAAQPYHAYIFANRRAATRIKVLMHDSIGVLLVTRRLKQGSFVWPTPGGTHLTLTDEQASAMGLGPPWQRLVDAVIIDCI